MVWWVIIIWYVVLLPLKLSLILAMHNNVKIGSQLGRNVCVTSCPWSILFDCWHHTLLGCTLNPSLPIYFLSLKCKYGVCYLRIVGYMFHICSIVFSDELLHMYVYVVLFAPLSCEYLGFLALTCHHNMICIHILSWNVSCRLTSASMLENNKECLFRLGYWLHHFSLWGALHILLWSSNFSKEVCILVFLVNK
jgi:hypothetical protein